MTSIASPDAAVHGIELTPGEEVVVTFPTYSRTLEIVVTSPGAKPIYWTSNGDPAVIEGGQCRIIPGQVIANDSQPAKRVYAPDVGDPAAASGLRTVCRMISETAATVSVQRSTSLGG
jgi:hypothetical protein